MNEEEKEEAQKLQQESAETEKQEIAFRSGARTVNIFINFETGNNAGGSGDPSNKGSGGSQNLSNKGPGGSGDPSDRASGGSGDPSNRGSGGSGGKNKNKDPKQSNS